MAKKNKRNKKKREGESRKSTRSLELKAELPRLEGLRNPSPYDEKTVLRFLSYVKKTPSCWQWEGSFTRDGYPQFWLRQNKVVKSHRFAYELFCEDLAEKSRLVNLCGNKQCVNPHHWQLNKPSQ
ncbi:MAG: hypothetical protein RML34_05930 [Leptospiraceae bacterium]|nr:hypothetical protein [Leptospiraceae bacterium]